jgi:magnesium-protoporphyrin IX monomethyl ester (oxidative) cyclase
MARRIKARNPGVVVVVGGANCEGVMGRTLVDQVDAIDFVFSGPSLKSFPALVRALLAGDEAGCHRIDGVFSRRNQVRFAGCSSGPAAEEGVEVKAFGEETDINTPVALDYGPFLDGYESNFPGEAPPQLFFETSRGCWWGERAHCTFCGLNGTTIGYRSMQPALAFQVFNHLFQYEGRCGDLSSVDNILPKSYLTDVLPYVDTPETMRFFYEVKADLTEGDFRVLAKSRVLLIQPGIEALNTSTLKLMRKGTSAFQNLQFLFNCVRYGISPAWNLLIGFPREEMEVYEKYDADLPLLTHLPPPGGVFPIRFDRFSPYHDEAQEYGLDLQPLDWYPLTYPWSDEVLAQLAYYFADHNYGAQYAVNAATMVMRLRKTVDRWTALWADPGTTPRLELRRAAGGAAAVFDSRSEEPLEYELDAGAVRLLDALSTPKKVASLVKELPGMDVEAGLERLRAHRLLFQENDRILSLIISPRTPITVPVESVGRAVAMA